jgi:hypothetical protein
MTPNGCTDLVGAWPSVLNLGRIIRRCHLHRVQYFVHRVTKCKLPPNALCSSGGIFLKDGGVGP